MSDLISRQAAIDVLDGIRVVGGRNSVERIKRYIEAVRDRLKQLPSAQPEPRWIPCSERLPEEYGNYLITTYDGNVDIGTIDPKGKSVWSACDADGFYWIRNVIAWKPLPDPWKGAER